jgi:hypothetical protein
MHPILPTGRHDLFFDEITALKITNSLVRNCCARESSTMVFRNISDDDYVAIQKLRHPITRATVHTAQFERATSSRRTWGTLDERYVIAKWPGPGAWRHPMPPQAGVRAVSVSPTPNSPAVDDP